MKRARNIVSGTFEFIVLAEILWYYTHDGEQTLHEALAELWEIVKARMEERGRIRSALDMIRDLPECDE